MEQNLLGALIRVGAFIRVNTAYVFYPVSNVSSILYWEAIIHKATKCACNLHEVITILYISSLHYINDPEQKSSYP